MTCILNNVHFRISEAINIYIWLCCCESSQSMGTDYRMVEGVGGAWHRAVEVFCAEAVWFAFYKLTANQRDRHFAYLNWWHSHSNLIKKAQWLLLLHNPNHCFLIKCVPSCVLNILYSLFHFISWNSDTHWSHIQWLLSHLNYYFIKISGVGKTESLDCGHIFDWCVTFYRQVEREGHNEAINQILLVIIFSCGPKILTCYNPPQL